MKNERQEIGVKVARIIWEGVSQPEGINSSELGQKIVEAVGGYGAFSVFGMNGVVGKLEEMRSSGVLEKTDRNTYVSAPIGANRWS